MELEDKDIIDLFGVKPNGERELIGKAWESLEMKSEELLNDYFGPYDEDDEDDEDENRDAASIALSLLIDYAKKIGMYDQSKLIIEVFNKEKKT